MRRFHLCQGPRHEAEPGGIPVSAMTQPPRAGAAISAPPSSTDERLRTVSPTRRLLARPEFGALSGAVLVFVMFGLSAGGSGMFSPEGIINWARSPRSWASSRWVPRC